MARYHSLVIAPRRRCRRRCASSRRARDDGEIMAVEHREHPVVGVQFHPESAATEYGYAMLDRFLHGDARARLEACRSRADGARRTTLGAPVLGRRPTTSATPFVPPPVEQVR